MSITPSCIDHILTNKPASFQNTTLIETGLSDFYKLTIIVMKCRFQKHLPNVIYYRNVKYFDNDAFKANLGNNLSTFGFGNISCDEFENLFMCILNERAPKKKRYIRANNAPFMNSELCKAIMSRSRLRNIFLKLKTNESREAYNFKIQRNYCVKLLRKTKSCDYENINVKIIHDNKYIWNDVKPLLFHKGSINMRLAQLKTITLYHIGFC